MNYRTFGGLLLIENLSEVFYGLKTHQWSSMVPLELFYGLKTFQRKTLQNSSTDRRPFQRFCLEEDPSEILYGKFLNGQTEDPSKVSVDRRSLKGTPFYRMRTLQRSSTI